MYLIVGLGNPGREYENTRHNMGFHFLDCLAEKYDVSISKEKFNGIYGEFRYEGEQIILLKPQSFMNLSGSVVSKYVDYFSIDLDHLLIIHDDLDLPLGSFRLRKCGSSGGHNGLKDIEHYLHTQNYKRLKLGISKNDVMDTKDYVLGKFSVEEKKILDMLEPKVISILESFVTEDFEQLMSQYNRKG